MRRLGRLLVVLVVMLSVAILAPHLGGTCQDPGPSGSNPCSN